MSMITAKFTGTIDNSTATPDSPMKAFYAQSVNVQHGPVVPPHVPEPPFPAAPLPYTAPGLTGNNALIAHDIKAAGGTVTTAAVPKGPAVSVKKKKY
jgi:hypothetical protein